MRFVSTESEITTCSNIIKPHRNWNQFKLKHPTWNLTEENFFKILNSVMNVNRIQKSVLAEKIKQFFQHDLAGKTVAIWGLAFKPNTDDIREAPALYIIDELLEAGASIQAYDPEAMDNVRELYGDRITLVDSLYEALEGADILAIITEWSVFRQPDFDKIKEMLSRKAIFDGRNLYNLDTIEKLGFYYESIGRNPVNRHLVMSNGKAVNS